MTVLINLREVRRARNIKQDELAQAVPVLPLDPGLDGQDTLAGHRLDRVVQHVQEHLAAELVTYHTGHRGDALLIGVE